MEKKFESELGKRIVEGNRRKSTKKVVLVIAAVSVMTLLVGAASFTMAQMACAGNSPVVDEAPLFDSQGDSITVGDDTAAKRVMNLKYRSVDPGTADSDLGVFKFTYAVNVYFKDAVAGIGSGIAVGNLVIVFNSDLVDGNVAITGTAVVLDGAGNVVTSSYTLPSDANVDLNVIDVTAAIPTIDSTVTLGAGYSVSINIQITIDDAPGLSGTATEQPWPTLYSEVYDVDIDTGELVLIDTVYDFDARTATFPI